MGFALGSQEALKRGEKPPYDRFSPPEIRDLDPSSYFPNSFSETVRKGSGVVLEPLIASLQQRKGFFDLFHRLLRLQFEADQGFSDSLSRQLGE